MALRGLFLFVDLTKRRSIAIGVSVFSADVLLRAELTPPFDPIWSGLIIATVIQLSGMLATAFIGRLADHWRRSTILMVIGGVGAASSALIEWTAG